MIARTLGIATALAVALLAQPPGQGGGNGDGIWERNAYYGEAQTFDSCIGHQPGNGQYHHHANPVCLRAQLNDNLQAVSTARTGTTYREKAAPWTHSPILGWAYDGYPVYGPYGYSDPTNASSAIKRLKPSYRLRNITDRTSLPDWTILLHTGVAQQLTATQFGPKITAQFPLGRYIEDYEYAQGLGDLDIYNGRTTVTPEFPQGTYAYYVTIDDNGKPAFPYIFAAQFYGAATGGSVQTVPATATDYAGGGAANLNSWATKNSGQFAQVVLGTDPTAAPSTTWPGMTSPAKTDVQRLRISDLSMYVNANGLASYVMGPWFEPQMPGGVFQNTPTVQNVQMQFPRAGAPTTLRRTVGMGAQGLWVNGVAIFNAMDGGSYSNSRGVDAGGGIITPTAVHVSAASFENGPMAPGSLVTAFSLFGTPLATSTDTAATVVWPTILAGATVSVKDAAGVAHSAPIYYASPTQINYLLPADCAVGNATVTITAGGTSSNGNITIRASYPNLFPASYTGDQGFLVVYGSGLGGSKNVTATAGGVPLTVAYAGAQGTYAGLDQFNLAIPATLAGKGKVDVVVTVDGKPSNTVSAVIP